MPKPPYYSNPNYFENSSSKAFFFRASQKKHSGTTIGTVLKKETKWDVQHELYHRFTMVYITEGGGTYIDHTGFEHALTPGSLFIRHPYYHHSSFIDPKVGWKEYFVSLGSHLLPVIQQLNILKGDILCTNIGVRKSLVDSFDHFLDDLENHYTHKVEEIEYRILGLMMEISKYIQGSSEIKGENEIILQCIRSIHQNLSSKRNIEEVLNDIPYSYSYLRKLFRKHQGVSLRQFWIEAKVDAACAFLLGQSLTISEIADKLGYPDPYTFSKQFKKNTGISPSEFRQNG